jgi:hypothetical protein
MEQAAQIGVGWKGRWCWSGHFEIIEISMTP